MRTGDECSLMMSLIPIAFMIVMTKLISTIRDNLVLSEAAFVMRLNRTMFEEKRRHVVQ